MSSHSTRILQALAWLMPTPLEAVVYFCIAALSVILSNAGFIRDTLLIPSNFHLGSAILGSVGDLMQQVFGENAAGSLSLAVFWGVVGMLVYVGIWLVTNFSTELSNDLAVTKYIHPRGVDTTTPLRDFISRNLFRLAIVIILIFDVNLAIRVLLPLWFTKYRLVITQWGHHYQFRLIILTFIGELLTFHSIVVLSRLVMLKKRVFGD